MQNTIFEKKKHFFGSYSPRGKQYIKNRFFCADCRITQKPKYFKGTDFFCILQNNC